MKTLRNVLWKQPGNILWNAQEIIPEKNQWEYSGEIFMEKICEKTQEIFREISKQNFQISTFLGAGGVVEEDQGFQANPFHI